MPEVCERREAEERSCTISVFRLQCGAGGSGTNGRKGFCYSALGNVGGLHA